MRERTEELTAANIALGKAKAEAEEANVSKTRFLAAASHDILQPLNAARLYTSSLVERVSGREAAELARNADASLDAVEEILTALLDISRLDSGAMKPEIGSVDHERTLPPARDRVRPHRQGQGPAPDLRALQPVDPDRPAADAAPAAEPHLERHQVHAIRTRPRRLPPAAGPATGSRSATPGIGIPQNRQKQVFREFQRLDQGALIARGLGPRPVDRGADRARARTQGLALFAARAKARSSRSRPLSRRPPRRRSLWLSVTAADHRPRGLAGAVHRQ